MRKTQINIRLTEDEQKALESLAEKLVRSKSNTIRYLILSAVGRISDDDRVRITSAGRQALQEESDS